MENITKCLKCGLDLIQEEIQIHECHTGKIRRFWADTDNDFVEIFDGFRWIPIKSTEKKQEEDSTDNEPIPL